MLMLKRRVGDVIHIGDDITIVISEIQADRWPYAVTIGVDAPRDVLVLRGELKQKGEDVVQRYRTRLEDKE